MPAPGPPLSAATPGRTFRRGVATLVVTLLVLELGARVATGALFQWGTEDRGRYGRFDPVVGYVLQPGLAVSVREGFSVHTDARGLRRNGTSGPVRERPATLVVGDSFAFGDEVHDHESWPAVLEEQTGERVWNAAMPGFGLDQAVLRAEQLTPELRPQRLLVSFIPHDIRRCEMSIWSGNAKPYFELGPSGLVEHPVPAAARWRLLVATPLSYSVLVSSLFGEALERDGPDTPMHANGVEVSCLLMDRLASLRDEHGVEVVVVAQPQTPLPGELRYDQDAHVPPRDDVAMVARVLACARERGLLTIDLIPIVAALPPEHRARLFRGRGHNSPEGNRFVAEALRTHLAATSAD